MTQQHTDILIVGAGMVGLSAALALAATGLKITLLDSQPAPSGKPLEGVDDYDPRVSALTCASQQILETLGAWPLMAAQRVSVYTDMAVWDGEGSGQIHFSCRDLHEPALGHIVENRVTVAALQQVAETVENLRCYYGVQISAMSEVSEGVRTLTDSTGQQWQAALVVGADGALSKVRQLAAIPLWEWDYGHHALVSTVTTAQSHQQTAWQCFTETGPLAFLPLDQDDHCSIVWSTTPDHARDLMQLDDAAFCAALSTAFEHRLGEVTSVAPRFSFPLRQRHAQYYVQSGLAVIGDAAHTIHPLAGQGVNIGLLDAAVLAEVVASAHARGEDVGAEYVLKRYQRQRHSENLQMSAAMEAFRRLYGYQHPWLKLIRNTGMNWIDRSGALKQHIVMQAMGLQRGLPALARRR